MPRKLSKPKPSELETTPGVRRAKSDQRRPLMGRLSMVFWSMVVEISAPEVCTSGVSPVTSTLSLTEPTVSLGVMFATPPTVTVMMSSCAVWKPSIVMVAP